MWNLPHSLYTNFLYKHTELFKYNHSANARLHQKHTTTLQQLYVKITVFTKKILIDLLYLAYL